MKTRSLIFGVIITGGALGIVLPSQTEAMTDEEFRALQQQMQQQSQEIQDLQKARLEDKQEIQKLKDQLGATQKTTDETQKKVEETQKKVEETQQTVTTAAEAAKAQPIHPVPSEGILATHNVSIVGDAEVQFVKTEGQHSSFLLADFAPIFLYRAGDNVLFEAGFDIALHNNFDSSGTRQAGSSTSVDLSFATLDYLFNDYVTLVTGDMLLPLGTYSERSAGWLNKIPDDPLPRSILPGSGIGVQLRGARAVGDSGQMVTYAIYGANGPSSADGTGDATALDLDGNVGDTPNWHSDPVRADASGGSTLGNLIMILSLGFQANQVHGTMQEDNCGRPPYSTPRFTSVHIVKPKASGSIPGSRLMTMAPSRRAAGGFKWATNWEDWSSISPWSIVSNWSTGTTSSMTASARERIGTRSAVCTTSRTRFSSRVTTNSSTAPIARRRTTNSSSNSPTGSDERGYYP